MINLGCPGHVRSRHCEFLRTPVSCSEVLLTELFTTNTIVFVFPFTSEQNANMIWAKIVSAISFCWNGPVFFYFQSVESFDYPLFQVIYLSSIVNGPHVLPRDMLFTFAGVKKIFTGVILFSSGTLFLEKILLRN